MMRSTMIRTLLILLTTTDWVQGSFFRRRLTFASHRETPYYTIRGGGGEATAKKNPFSNLSLPNAQTVVTNVAKIAATMTLAQGSVGVLWMVKAVEEYDFANRLLMAKLVEQASCATLAVGMQAYWSLFKQADTTQALGMSALPFVILSAKALLRGDATKFGYAWKNDLTSLTVASIVGFACLIPQTKPSPKLIQGFGVLQLATGAFIAAKPVTSFQRFWGSQKAVDDEPVVVQIFGAWLAVQGIYTTALASNVDSPKAFLLSLLPIAIACLGMPPADPRFFALVRFFASIESPFRKVIVGIFQINLKFLTSIRRRVEKRFEKK